MEIKIHHMGTAITTLFKVQYPLIQAGMIWCSGWELASAVSNSGGLGIIGSGSMYPDVLDEQIKKCKINTNKINDNYKYSSIVSQYEQILI